MVWSRADYPNRLPASRRRTRPKQIENIVISMGAEGVMWLHENQWLHAKPPKMPVVSTVGAGDTLVAGLCWGHMQRMEKNLCSVSQRPCLHLR